MKTRVLKPCDSHGHCRGPGSPGGPGGACVDFFVGNQTKNP